MKIIANFKMNKSATETKDYLINFIPKSADLKHDTIFCFPYTSLGVAKFMTKGTNINIGAQNLSEEDEGKCTGEISGAMLKDLGVHYVIVGHSERRSKFKENNKIINKKIKQALKNGLKVVLCVGESLAEKKTLKITEVLTEQIEEALKGIYENELENIIIAYEPIWAIGSGMVPTVREIDSSAGLIRKIISNDFSENAGNNICVVYGGSVNTKNVVQIAKAKKINGFLIGGACLDPNNLIQIMALINR